MSEPYIIQVRAQRAFREAASERPREAACVELRRGERIARVTPRKLERIREYMLKTGWQAEPEVPGWLTEQRFRHARTGQVSVLRYRMV